MIELFDLSNKVAIVTGCATGLGQAMALGLAEAGADIVGVDYYGSTGGTQEAVEGLGRRFLAVKADLGDMEMVKSIVPKTVEAFGRVDILVNNAGLIRRNPSVTFSEKDWDDVMNVNLKAVFFLAQSAARQFIAQQSGGKIINIASMLSFQGGILVPSYTASKSGVMGLTRLMACEWAKDKINVNAIAPGYMATNNTQPIREDVVRNQQILDRIPAGRWGKPEDLKGVAIFLASAASDYMNGYTIAVDGGWLAR